MLKVLPTTLLNTVIFGIVMRISPSLAARATTLFRHPLARTIIFWAVLRLIRIRLGALNSFIKRFLELR